LRNSFFCGQSSNSCTFLFSLPASDASQRLVVFLSFFFSTDPGASRLFVVGAVDLTRTLFHRLWISQHHPNLSGFWAGVFRFNSSSLSVCTNRTQTAPLPFPFSMLYLHVTFFFFLISSAQLDTVIFNIRRRVYIFIVQ